MRGAHSRLRHHSKDKNGDYHQRITWQTYWKYHLPIMEAKEVGVEKKLSAVGKELEAYKHCKYTFETLEKFTSNRAEWENTYDLFIPNNLQL